MSLFEFRSQKFTKFTMSLKNIYRSKNLVLVYDNKLSVFEIFVRFGMLIFAVIMIICECSIIVINHTLN